MDLMSGRFPEEDKSKSRLTRIGRIFWTEGIKTRCPSVTNI